MVRASGVPSFGSDADVAAAAVEVMSQFVARVARAFGPLSDQVAAVVAVVDELPVDELPCLCWCAVHRADGVVCGGERTCVVVVVGGLVSPVGVPMCPPCGVWWTRQRPHRVDGVRALEALRV